MNLYSLLFDSSSHPSSRGLKCVLFCSQILGIVMTSVGSAGMSNQYSALVGSTLPTGVTVLGVFVMLISLVGCVGAKRENRIILAIVTFASFSRWISAPIISYHFCV